MSEPKNTLSVDVLNKLFSHDAKTGDLRWRVDRGRVSAGIRAGCINTEGYRVVGYLGVQYRVHRIIWAMHYGEWPNHQIDHIDGNKLNNAINNLRACDYDGNARNVSKKAKQSSSKHKGVDRHRGRWRARIRTGDGKRLDLGYFRTEEEAAAAYADAAGKFHGEFARL